jgi:hypothetical protein
MADLIVVGHLNESRTRAKNINEVVHLPYRLHQQIVRRTGSVVKEKNASERGKKGRGESGVTDDHKLIRMMRRMSDIVIARGNITARQPPSFARLGHEPEAHVTSSQVTKTNG